AAAPVAAGRPCRGADGGQRTAVGAGGKGAAVYPLAALERDCTGRAGARGRPAVGQRRRAGAAGGRLVGTASAAAEKPGGLFHRSPAGLCAAGPRAVAAPPRTSP